MRIATTGAAQVSASEAFMVPPPGGPAVVAVLEERYRNALAQDIVLQNNTGIGGQNALYVRAFGPMGRDAGRGRLGADIPSLSGIRRELRQYFPGVPMEISGLYAQNKYGPLGYATGRARSGANCVYVWQRIAGEPRLFKVQRGSITWRLRLCDPKTSVRDLLFIAYGFTVAGYFASPNWNPYGEGPELDPRVGKRGEVIFPEQDVSPAVVAPVAFGESRRVARVRQQSTTPRARTRSTRQAAPTPTVVNRPLPGAAVVPRPENTDLSEPAIRDSNLPTRAPRAGEHVEIPAPRAAPPPTTVPAPPSTVPTPSQSRLIIPPANGPAPPSVRVVGAS
ncbi:MAG: cellulose biosynthesis protein BcsN [Pseudomonadota bacterium]